jgi:hypothetical protein
MSDLITLRALMGLSSAPTRLSVVQIKWSCRTDAAVHRRRCAGYSLGER